MQTHRCLNSIFNLNLQMSFVCTFLIVCKGSGRIGMLAGTVS